MLKLYVDKNTLSPTQTILYKQIEECYSPQTEYIVFQLRNNKIKGKSITPNEIKNGIYQGIKDYIQYYMAPLRKRYEITDKVIKSIFDYTGVIEYTTDDTTLNLHIHLFIKPKVEVSFFELIVLMKDRITLKGRKKDDLVDKVFNTNLFDYSYSDDFITYHTKTFKDDYITENVLTNIDLD